MEANCDASEERFARSQDSSVARTGCKVPLPAILDLRPRISQYGRAIHTLRHRYGFLIENGVEEGHPDHTWFRLVGHRLPSPDTLEDKEIALGMRAEIETAKTSNGGWTREQLKTWDVPWPPPRGWKKELEIKGQPTKIVESSQAIAMVQAGLFGDISPDRSYAE